jgi:hypothetical protein
VTDCVSDEQRGDQNRKKKGRYEPEGHYALLTGQAGAHVSLSRQRLVSPANDDKGYHN